VGRGPCLQQSAASDARQATVETVAAALRGVSLRPRPSGGGGLVPQQFDWAWNAVLADPDGNTFVLS